MRTIKTTALAFICAVSILFGLTTAPSAAASVTLPSAATTAQASASQPRFGGAAVRVFREIITRVPQLVNVAKRGWSAFKSFWDSKVPWYVKMLLWGFNLYDLYQWIRQNFG